MAERPLAPIEHLFTNMKCTICGGPAGTCDCWTECRCGWSFEKGGECRNPQHGIEDAAELLAEDIALCVIERMRYLYPEPMKHASGGFRKTLHGTIKQQAKSTLVIWGNEFTKARDG